METKASIPDDHYTSNYEVIYKDDHVRFQKLTVAAFMLSAPLAQPTRLGERAQTGPDEYRAITDEERTLIEQMAQARREGYAPVRSATSEHDEESSPDAEVTPIETVASQAESRQSTPVRILRGAFRIATLGRAA